MEILLTASPPLPLGLGRGTAGDRELLVLVLPAGGVRLQPHVGGVGLQRQRGGVVGVGDVLVVVVPAVHVEGEVSAGDVEGGGVIIVGVLVVDTVAAGLLTGPTEVVAAVEELVALVKRRYFNVDMGRSVVTEAGILYHWSHSTVLVLLFSPSD